MDADFSKVQPNDQNNAQNELWDIEWLKQRREYFLTQLSQLSFHRHMEILLSPTISRLDIAHENLQRIALKSHANGNGWPIGAVMLEDPTRKPKPKVDGIVSEITGIDGKSLNYSYFRKSGQVFIARSLFEEYGFPASILPDRRIRQTTELLKYVIAYYKECKLPVDEPIRIDVTYSGFRGNDISYGLGRDLILRKVSEENECPLSLTASISEIEPRLAEFVDALTRDFFILFDRFSVSFDAVEDLVADTAQKIIREVSY